MFVELGIMPLNLIPGEHVHKKFKTGFLPIIHLFFEF